MINPNQNPFCAEFLIVSACLASLKKFFERQARIAHLHSAECARSSPSRCFQLSTNLDKDLFRCFLCWDARTIFTNFKRLSCVSFTK